MFNISSGNYLGFKLSLAKLLSDFITFLVNCQSVTAEKSTIDAVVGNSTKFQWLVDRNGSSLLSLLIVHGTEFSRSRILFTMAGDKFTPALLATNDFKGRLNATISGDLEKDPKFFCTLTFNDLQLTDENEKFLLHVTFSDNVIKQNVVTLREVRGIYCFLSFFISIVFCHVSSTTSSSLLIILSFFPFYIYMCILCILCILFQTMCILAALLTPLPRLLLLLAFT